MKEFDTYTIHKPKAVSFDFSRFDKPKSGATSNRASLIEPFVKRLQSSCIGTKYKPMSEKRICMLMAYIDTDDLEGFYKKLEQSPNFGAIWNWYVNPKDLNGGKSRG
jgi:hypothetical protein